MARKKNIFLEVEDRLLLDSHGVDDSRGVFNSILADHKNKVMVSTDGRRMCVSSDAYARNIASYDGAGVGGLRDGETETLLVPDDVSKFMIGGSEVMLRSKDTGSFPDWKQVVPMAHMNWYRIEVPEWIGALTDLNVPAKLMLTEHGSLVLHQSRFHNGSGMIDERISMRGITVFDGRYLAPLAGETVYVYVSESTPARDPLVILPEGQARDGDWINESAWVYVLMPMKVWDTPVMRDIPNVKPVEFQPITEAAAE